MEVNKEVITMGEKLAEVISKFDDKEILLNELRAIDDDYIETIEDLIDYLEAELEYASD